MKSAKGILFLYSQSFLHPGAGSSAGVIDLPVQREVHTNYPVISASGLKGSLRDLAEKKSLPKELVERIFGPEIQKGGNKDEKGFAGALTIGDAKLLAMPIRSFTRSFFWVTCPLALGRFRRDLKTMGIKTNWDEIKITDPKTAYVPDIPEDSQAGGTLFLEELDFQIQADSNVKLFTQFLAGYLKAHLIGPVYHDKIQRDLAVVSDSDFNYLVRFGTQVTARTQLTSRKTTDTVEINGQTERGNLWYEETLPPESIFYAPVLAEPARDNAVDPEWNSGDKVLGKFEENILAENFIQVGGNETLGQGWCVVSLVKEGAAS